MRIFVGLLLVIGILTVGLVGTEPVFGQRKAPERVTIPELKDIPKLINQLKDKDPDKRALAIAGIAKRGELRAKDVLEAVAPLCQLATTDPDTIVREQACYALGTIVLEPKESVEALTKVLEEDKELGVKRAAAAAIGPFGGNAKSAISALRDAQKLGQEADKAIRDAQIAKTKVENEGVRRAEAALGQAAGGALQQIAEAGK
jgi:HEAT repeat protein